MKAFASIAAIALAAVAVNGAAVPGELEARCIANGNTCYSNGHNGVCCSGFCLQQIGVCSVRNTELYRPSN